MSGINWKLMGNESEGCKNVKELEELLKKCKVGDNEEVWSLIKRCVGKYGDEREYRRNRNVSMGELRKENKRLKGLVKE